MLYNVKYVNAVIKMNRSRHMESIKGHLTLFIFILFSECAKQITYHTTKTRVLKIIINMMIIFVSNFISANQTSFPALAGDSPPPKQTIYCMNRNA